MPNRILHKLLPDLVLAHRRWSIKDAGFFNDCGLKIGPNGRELNNVSSELSTAANCSDSNHISN